MNRYLFLDIDGVLNSERTVAAFGKLTHAGLVHRDLIVGRVPEPMWDPISIKMLQEAQKVLDFKIVISSTWRQSLPLNLFHELFDIYGWDTRDIIIGKTGTEAGPRGNQIKNWIDNYGKYPYQYCIIDDDSDMLPTQSNNFVKVDFNNGISYENFEQIFRVFGEQYKQVGTLELTT